MPLKPHDFAPRDHAIVLYMARYVIAIYACLEKRFIATGNCGTVAKRLSTAFPHEPKKRPLTQLRSKSLPKGRSYLQLTTAGCRQSGVSLAHAAPLRTAALDLAIAIQWACTFGSVERHRVTQQEILPLLGKDTPANNVPHVVAVCGEKETALLRVYHALSDLQSSVNHLAELAANASQRPVLSKWLHARQYGFLVLCPTRAFCSAMQNALSRRGLADSFHFEVDLGPTAETLDTALRGPHA